MKDDDKLIFLRFPPFYVSNLRKCNHRYRATVIPVPVPKDTREDIVKHKSDYVSL